MSICLSHLDSVVAQVEDKGGFVVRVLRHGLEALQPDEQVFGGRCAVIEQLIDDVDEHVGVVVRFAEGLENGAGVSLDPFFAHELDILLLGAFLAFLQCHAVLLLTSLPRGRR